MTGNMLSNIIPGRGGVAHTNEFKSIYIGGDANTPESWRLIAEGEHPENHLKIQHRDTMTENAIALDDAKVTSVQNDVQWTEDNHFYATVLTDTRADLNIPPALAGTMAGKVVIWDGSVWEENPNEWITKAQFHDSVETDRAIMRRVNIIDSDPNDGFAFPPAPADGLILGSRSIDIGGTRGAHLSMQTSDGITATFLNLTHSGPPAFGVIENDVACLKVDNSVAGFEWTDHQTGKDYALGDPCVVGGTAYLNVVQGVQINHWPTESYRWLPQSRDQVMNSAMIDAAGNVMVDASGNIMRGFAT